MGLGSQTPYRKVHSTRWTHRNRINHCNVNTMNVFVSSTDCARAYTFGKITFYWKVVDYEIANTIFVCYHHMAFPIDICPSPPLSTLMAVICRPTLLRWKIEILERNRPQMCRYIGISGFLAILWRHTWKTQDTIRTQEISDTHTNNIPYVPIKFEKL